MPDFVVGVTSQLFSQRLGINLLGSWVVASSIFRLRRRCIRSLLLFQQHRREFYFFTCAGWQPLQWISISLYCAVCILL